MFVVPYIYLKKESIYPIHIFHIFLNQGILFLQMNWDEIDDFCNENEIYFSKKTINKEYCYLEVDSIKTNLKNFYSFIDNSQAECWRRFILTGNANENYLHINDTNPEFIQQVLKNILELNIE